MMDLLNAQELTQLADGHGGTRISLFLPTHPHGRQTVRNRIRLKNLLRHAEHALRGDGVRAGQIDAILEPGRQLLDMTSLWDQHSHGLALFLGPDRFRHLRVPLRLPELVVVGNRFVVRPLLPLLTANGHFYVLTLSQDEIRLFEGTRSSLEEVALDGLPLAVWLTMPRRRPQVHAFLADRGGAGSGTVFHGAGGGEEDTKGLLLQHFQRVDQALHDVLPGEGAPLVLAGVRWLQAVYRRANTYPGLAPTGLDGNPRDIPLEVMHGRAWAIAEPVLRGDETAAARTYRALRGTGRTSSHIGEVARAAEQGRVDVLFQSIEAPGWGAGADTGPLVRLGDTPDKDEQLDRAAVAALRHGGRVYAVPAARMPDSHPIAAILRY